MCPKLGDVVHIRRASGKTTVPDWFLWTSGASPLTCNCHSSLTISFLIIFNKIGPRAPHPLVNSLPVTSLSVLPSTLRLKLRLPHCCWLAYLFALEMISTPMMWWKAVQGSLESLMHFNENPGESNLRGLWEGNSGCSPALWQLIRPLVFIIPCNSPSPFFGVNLTSFSTFLPLSNHLRETLHASSKEELKKKRTSTVSL